MPLPSPKKGQEQDKFISSCMGDSKMRKEYPDQKQRAAVCHSQHKRRKKQSKGGEVEWEDQSTNDYTILY